MTFIPGSTPSLRLTRGAALVALVATLAGCGSAISLKEEAPPRPAPIVVTPLPGEPVTPPPAAEASPVAPVTPMTPETPAPSATPPAATAPAAGSTTMPISSALSQELAPGLYEVAYDRDTVFVAAAGKDLKDGQPGEVFLLDPASLHVKRSVRTPGKPFALGINKKTGTLFAGQTLDGSVVAIDTANAVVRGGLRLAQPDANGKVSHTRKVVVDEAHDRLFVTNPEEAGKVWIIDGARGQLLRTVENIRKHPTGAVYDETTNRLYVSQGGTNGISVIDPETGTILQQFPVGAQERFLINVSMDKAGQRLFAADANQGEMFVFDARSGSILRQVPVGDGALDILFNPRRNEIYVSTRGVTREKRDGSGKVTVFDGATYAVKRTYDFPGHPNSLALDDAGDTLFLTVKGPRDAQQPGYRADGLENVVRIDLR